MAQQEHPSADAHEKSPGDPWHAFGYLISGVLMYGLIGWGLDMWLGTTYLVAAGILIGSGMGIYLTWSRFNRGLQDHEDKTQVNETQERL